VVCDPAEAIQQQFQQWATDFIAIHDINTDSSPRILAGLAAATQRKVQKLVIRRQGHGVALATLEFAELPGANGQMLRAGDGLGITEAGMLNLTATDDAEIVLFDLAA